MTTSNVTKNPVDYTTLYRSDNVLELLMDEDVPQGADGESEELLDQMNDHLYDVFNNNFPAMEIDWRDDRTCWIWLLGYGKE